MWCIEYERQILVEQEIHLKKWKLYSYWTRNTTYTQKISWKKLQVLDNPIKICCLHFISFHKNGYKEIKTNTREDVTFFTTDSDYLVKKYRTYRILKLTSYSAFVLWTLIANGSVGWNVKATTRRAEVGGLFPRTPD